jgi:hypothetical protein
METWLFENPWPLGAAIAILGAAAAWRGLAGESRPLLVGGLVAIVAGAAVILVGRSVRTPGEHAEEVARALVAHAEAARTDEALALFTPDAVLNYGRRENPGVSMVDIRAALRSLEGRYRIDSNRIRRLEVRTLDDATGEVELSCTTSLARLDTGVPTDWILRVRKRGDRWLIDRITFETLYGKPPTPGIWR